MAGSSTSAFLSQINDEFLKCPVCFDHCEKPKVLPCLHSFCMKCLEKLVKDGSKTVECPKCRQEEILPENGIHGLQDNFFISDLAESMSTWKSVEDENNQPVCSGCCSRDAANSRCLTCLDFLCDNCVALHKQLRVFRNHMVVTLEQIRAGEHVDSLRVKLEPLKCELHEGEILRFYCSKCEVPICRDCTVLDHPKPDHPFINLKDAVEKHRSDLKALLGSTSTKVKAFDEALVKVEKAVNHLAENRQKSKEDIERIAAEIKEKIDNNQAELLRQLEDSANIKDKQLQAIGDHLQMELCKMNSACELAENILEVGTEWEVVSLHKQLASRMQELERTPLADQDNELKVLGHVALVHNVISASENMIGKIDVDNLFTTIS
ncbi:tripartite motif-containing protein 2-like [Saccoglossus kowalevskii]|uniref:Tripartite motif-containing protein 2-like n=1 Tax=Saccoglossus kowalevskii TaxID=10224 RepID=A0ABM0GMF6_SACKO|nr:PREDICTED: tripartite motif-containing protein 2-like [Saccoglossus kowalevskii]